jgi:hypothetical protein
MIFIFDFETSRWEVLSNLPGERAGDSLFFGWQACG